MWIPKYVFDWLHISKDTVSSLREDLAAIRAERDGLKGELANVRANFDWIRIRINQLEAERAQLIDKAYGIKIPVPEIARAPRVDLELGSDIFEDMGERKAKELGLPIYASPFEDLPN